MPARLLVIDSELLRHDSLRSVLALEGYEADIVPHEEGIGCIGGPDFGGYTAVLIQVAPQPSRASDAFRTGEYVLHYIAQLRPEALPRVLLMLDGLPEAPDRIRVGGVVTMPLDGQALLAAIRAVRGAE